MNDHSSRYLYMGNLDIYEMLVHVVKIGCDVHLVLGAQYSLCFIMN